MSDDFRGADDDDEQRYIQRDKEADRQRDTPVGWLSACLAISAADLASQYSSSL